MDNTKDIDNPFIKDGSSCSGKLTKEEQAKILEDFAKKILSQKDMPPKYQKLASEHFWELI